MLFAQRLFKQRRSGTKYTCKLRQLGDSVHSCLPILYSLYKCSMQRAAKSEASSTNFGLYPSRAITLETSNFKLANHGSNSKFSGQFFFILITSSVMTPTAEENCRNSPPISKNSAPLNQIRSCPTTFSMVATISHQLKTRRTAFHQN